jgi:YVTN family beta-propeller protein
MLHTFPISRAAVVAGLMLVTATSALLSAAPVTIGDGVGSQAERLRQGRTPDAGLLFNGWGIAPAGQAVQMSDIPLKIVISPDGQSAAIVSSGFNSNGLTILDIPGHKVSQFIPLQHVWNGAAFSPDGKALFVTGGNSGLIYRYSFSGGKATEERSAEPAAGEYQTFLAGVAVHPTTGKLYVCDEGAGEVWVVSPDTLKREQSITVGAYPHTCVFGGDRRHLYVSNWGGRSVSVIDTNTNKRVRDIEVGIRPNDMALAPDGRLFVVCAGDNTVRVIQTRTLEAVEPGASRSRPLPEGVREVLSTSLYPSSPEGSTPDGVAVSPDGKMLYVVNADNNDCMVADISDRNATQVLGFIPTGWYPTSVAVAPDNQTVLLGNGKGLQFYPNAGPNAPHPGRPKPIKPPGKTYIAQLLQGSISYVARSDAAGIAAYTATVRRDCPYRPSELRSAPISSASVIPDHVGGSCPIHYVLYIIKENRTYDQIFGDFKNADGQPAGNGDPDLVMYGEKVTPNQHALARKYVLLDNLYCNGEVSVDGHSWCDAAIATDFNECEWMMSYSGHGHIPGNDERAAPAAGYLWDLCRRHGISCKNYGEMAGRVPNEDRGTWPGGRDPKRAEGWISDLKTAEKTGDLPQLMVMSLGEDHTKGATPGAHTPAACVASNDIAVGRIVEAASHSKLWPEMAIFIMEDDAQDGPDHVDAHRTSGLVVSPYVRRGVVDSTLYTTSSMVRTIELILGLPPMTQYDAAATPMFNCFQVTPQDDSYTLIPASIDINAVNPKRGPGARASKAMDFKEYDHAPADPLNRILWRLAKGPGVPYPAPVHRLVLMR